MEKYYKISEEKLRDLLDAYYRLVALERGGVDNWSWYIDSIQDFLKSYNEKNPNSQARYIEEITTIEINNYDVIGEE